MKEKILSLAQGKFRYQLPKLQLSLERLVLQVEEGGESSEQLVISNDEGTKIKGFGASKDIHFDFFPIFHGKENQVTVRVKAGNRKAGETLTGALYLVTDCGEQTLPYEVKIIKSYLKDSTGRQIKGYEEFVRFVGENPEEAVRIFYHERFLDQYLEKLEDKRLYQHLTKRNSKKHALQEFLVAHGDVKPVVMQEEKPILQQETVVEKTHRRSSLEKKKKWKKVVKAHLQYIMNSSRRERWLEVIRDFISEDCILDGYLAYQKKDEEGMEKYLNVVSGIMEPQEDATMEQVLRYLIAQYVKCKINKNELDKDEFYAEVRQYQSEGYQHILCTVLLERMGYYEENVMGLWDDLNQLWADGCYSPYLYLYQAMILLQEPDLLVRLDAQTVGICRFALRYDLLTENEVLAISFLAAKKKRETPAILSLLMGCYAKFHTIDTLHSICALLIRGEKQGPQYLKWFELGVKNHLRLTELYEYYMYSLQPEDFSNLNPAVYSYFQYENHLRDSVKARFFLHILEHRETHPTEYEAYEDAIYKYVISQVKNGKVNEVLARLYDQILPNSEEVETLYSKLPEILFAHRVSCKTQKTIVRVVVVHDEGGGEHSYPMHDGEAVIHIATPNYRIYFVDDNGYYYAGTVDYELKKMCHLDSFIETCYNYGSDSFLVKLNLFSKMLMENVETSTKEAILIHELIRSDMLGVEYQHKGLLILYDYYRSIGEDALLEEVIRSIDFHYISRERQAGILQTMIQYQMNEDALGVFRKYELTECTPKLILLLITWVLEEKQQKFDPYYMRLCDFLYDKGEKNKVTLSYLLNYYMGDTKKLLEFYKAAEKAGVEIRDGALERLLGQALFIGADLTAFEEPFAEYYEYGDNRILVKAFLSEISYEYLTDRLSLNVEWKNRIAKEGLATQDPVLVLALLKYFSAQETLTDNEREWTRFQLAEFAAKGQYLAFMKEFRGKMEVPFEIDNARMIQWIATGRGDVYIELNKENLLPMQEILPDVYCFATILFSGEKCQYSIFQGDMNVPVKEGELVGGKPDSSTEPSFFRMIQEMIEAKDTDQELYAKRQKEFRERKNASAILLKPLSWEGEAK
ncbi:MAG: DUF5717 family protein [Eubacterium sp.]